jgi:hypothetical protein
MRRLIFVLAIVLCAMPMLADDLFTLYVPVRVSHLHPSVTQITVRCTLSGRDTASGASIIPGPAGGKSQSFPVTGGAYSGTATIVFTNADFTPAQLASLTGVTGGICTMTLVTTTGLYVPYDSGTGAVTGHAAGTPFSNPVYFTIH